MSDAYSTIASSATGSPQAAPDDPYAGVAAAPSGLKANIGAGLTEGVTGTVGGLVDLLNPVNHAREIGHDIAGAWRSLTGPPQTFAQLLAEEQRFHEENNPTTHKLNKALEAVTGYNPENTPATTPGERIGRTAASFLPSALIPVGEGYTIANLMKAGAVAAGAGTASGVAQEAAPEGSKEAAGFLASLAGGVATGTALHSRAAVRGAGRLAEPVVAAVAPADAAISAEVGRPTSAPVARAAAETLNRRATNPATVSEMLQSTPGEIVPGSEPTTFQKTGDMGLGSLEREQAVKRPDLFKAREAEQQQARVTALQDVQRGADPAALTETMRGNLDVLDNETSARVAAATSEAATKAAGIGGAGTPEVTGSAVREAIADAEAGARQQERGLWKAVDPNGDMTGNITATRQAANDIVDAMPKTAKPMAGDEAGVFDAARQMPQLAPVSDLIALRSRTSDAMRNELVQNGRTASYARLVQLRGAIQDNLANTIAHQVAAEEAAASLGEIAKDQTVGSRIQAWVNDYRTAREAEAGAGGGAGPAGAAGGAAPSGPGPNGAGVPGQGGPGGAAGDQGVPGGATVAPTFDEAAAARLAAATEATKARARTFGMEPVAPTLAKAGAADLYRLPEARVPEKFFHPGAAAYGHMQALYAAIGREAGEKLMGEYAALSLRRAAIGPDGLLDPAKFQRWAQQHSDALRALSPDVRARFADAAQASRTVAAVQTARAAAMKDAQAGAVGRLLGAREPEDVTRTIGNILGSRTAVADMGRIAELARGDPAAKAGLRQAVADFMLSRVISNAEAGTSGVNALKGDTFATFFKRARPALAKVFTPSELNTMEAVTRDVQRSRRSIEATKLSGGSNTAQDVAGVRAHTTTGGMVSNSILGVLAERLTAVTTHNEPMALAAGLGAAVVGAMRDAGLRRTDELVTHAMLHPKVAEALMRRFPAEPNGRNALHLASTLRRTAAASGVGMLAQPNRAQRQP